MMLTFNESIQSITAFAPASCGNMAVGYDILGFAIQAVGDEITLTRYNGEEPIIEFMESNDDLPHDPDKNVASAVIKAFCQEHQLPAGFKLRIKKGIALGSGMGGSAASAVAALTALNGFLTEPVSRHQLANYAIDAERIACGYPHPDNAIPCLFGGITLIQNTNPLAFIQLPTPNVFSVLVHPHLRLDTRTARAALPDQFLLSTYVKQSANLAGLIAALYENNLDLIKRCLSDVLIEPWRAPYVSGFSEVKQAALEAGALGASLSGSGPSVFALAETRAQAKKISEAMVDAFKKSGVQSDAWISQLDKEATGSCIIARRVD